jgi:hypothetical protein
MFHYVLDIIFNLQLCELLVELNHTIFELVIPCLDKMSLCIGRIFFWSILILAFAFMHPLIIA